MIKIIYDKKIQEIIEKIAVKIHDLLDLYLLIIYILSLCFFLSLPGRSAANYSLKETYAKNYIIRYICVMPSIYATSELFDLLQLLFSIVQFAQMAFIYPRRSAIPFYIYCTTAAVIYGSFRACCRRSAAV